MTEYNIRLNPNCASAVHTGLKFKAGDKGIKFVIAVDELDTTGTTAKIVFLRANGTSVESDITGADGVFIYKTLGNEFAVPGKTIADVKFYTTDARVSTASFIFEVSGDTMDGLGAGTGGYSDRLEQLTAEAETAGKDLKETEEEMAAVLQNFKEQYGEVGALNPRGDWNSEDTYQIRDVVYYNSCSWISLVDGNNMEPSDGNKAYWMRSTDLESIINGTTPVAKATDADTVDGKHASDFASAEHFVKSTAGSGWGAVQSKNPNTGEMYRLQMQVDGRVTINYSSDGGVNWRIVATLTKDFLPLTGGTLSNILSLREYLNVYANSSNAETYSSFIQNANGTHVRHVTDANNFDEFFIKQGSITYAKMVNGEWTQTDVLHTGNSKKVTSGTSAPTDTAALWYDTTNKTWKRYVDGAWTA